MKNLSLLNLTSTDLFRPPHEEQSSRPRQWHQQEPRPVAEAGPQAKALPMRV